MSETPAKRGVGIKFRTTGLTEVRMREWLFDQVGEVKVLPRGVHDGSDVSQELRAYDHDEKGHRGYGLFVAFIEHYSTDRRGWLRIGIWGTMDVETAWKIIGEHAINLVAECRCQLDSHAHDLYEDGKGLIYDEQLAAGKTLPVVEVPIKGAKPGQQPIPRMN